VSDPRLAALPDWVEVCEREVDYVYWTLRRFGANAVDAEDLTQEVFLTMWRRRDTFDPARPVRAWIAGISFRVFSEHRRRTRREVPGGFMDLADERPGADERMVTAQARALVLAALARVPEKQRTVLVMREIDGNSMRDIAEALSVPLFTLYSRLKSARRTFAREVRRRQVIFARPSAEVDALLAEERAPAPAPPQVRRRVMARLRALTPPAPEAPAPPPPPAPRSPWPMALAAVVLMAASLSGVAVDSTTVAPAGLIGHWTFDDGAGSAVARDSSGRNNDCVLQKLDAQQAWRPGAVGSGLSFADRGWLECRRTDVLAALTTELTIGAWVTRGKVLPAYHALVSRQKGDGREDQFMFGFANGELVFASHIWHRRLMRPLPANLGEWFHVAVTRSHDGTLILYVDGAEIGRAHSLAGRLEGGDNPLIIGAAQNDTDHDHAEAHFDGAMDDLVIYDRALSPADVAALAVRSPSHPVVSTLRP
jgi:RNA polymerase sigma-70 factor (ECF subfamily)